MHVSGKNLRLEASRVAHSQPAGNLYLGCVSPHAGFQLKRVLGCGGTQGAGRRPHPGCPGTIVMVGLAEKTV